jgi:NAD-dependent SIR2 family protein deacetylase
MHAGLRPFQCSKCDKSFATKSSLDRHDAVRHQEATPFHCTQCYKAFKTKDNLKKHVRVHQEPKFSCEVNETSQRVESYIHCIMKYFDKMYKHRVMLFPAKALMYVIKIIENVLSGLVRTII